MLTVSEHVYDEATGIDHYVFEPGAMKAQVKVTETNGEPQVLLGVEGMAVQQSVSEPTWTVCKMCIRDRHETSLAILFMNNIAIHIHLG